MLPPTQRHLTVGSDPENANRYSPTGLTVPILKLCLTCSKNVVSQRFQWRRWLLTILLNAALVQSHECINDKDFPHFRLWFVLCVLGRDDMQPGTHRVVTDFRVGSFVELTATFSALFFPPPSGFQPFQRRHHRDRHQHCGS